MPNRSCWHIQEHTEALDPLVQQLLPVYDHQRIDLPCRDQPRGYSCPSKGGWRTEYAFVVADNLADSIFLQRPQLSLKFRFNRDAWTSFISHFRPYLVCGEERECLLQASTRDGDVLGKVLSACDHSRFVPG